MAEMIGYPDYTYNDTFMNDLYAEVSNILFYFKLLCFTKFNPINI